MSKTAKEQMKTGSVDVPLDAWDSTTGESFGGVATPIALAVNQVSPVLEFTRMSSVQLKDTEKTADGKEVEVSRVVPAPVAVAVDDPKKADVSLPIGAIFRKTWAEAKCIPGDRFLIKRFPDAKKKGGRGSGTAMQVYGLKVVYRAPREQPAAITAGTTETLPAAS